MKKQFTIAAATLCTALSAHAQSSVTIYGIVDTGVEYLNHSGPDDRSMVRMPNITASVPSRFGLRGSEDLGGGLKALFVLESGIAIDTGALNYGNRLFGRQALVGLSSKYGTLSLGRQYNMTFYALLDSDTMGPNIHAMVNLDSYLPNTRSDNAVGYLGKFDGFSVGSTYSLGRDAGSTGGPQATNCAGEKPGDAQACRQWTGMVKYDGGAYGVSGSYDRMHGGVGALFGLTSSNYTDTRSTVNGFVKWGTTKIGGGVISRRNEAVTSLKSNLVYLGLTQPIAEAWVVDAQVANLDIKSTKNDAAILALRLSYNFSRRTASYLSVGHIVNKGASAVGVSPGATTLAGLDQSGVMLGLRHSF